MLFLLSPIHTPVHMHTPRQHTHMHTISHTHRERERVTHKLRPTRWGGEKERKKERKKKSIAGDSGARRRIVSCQNNILPSSPPDRCGGLGTEGSLSPLLSFPLFLLGAWCSLIFTSVKERPRRLSALIDSDTWSSVLRLRMREGGQAGMQREGRKERKKLEMEDEEMEDQNMWCVGYIMLTLRWTHRRHP